LLAHAGQIAPGPANFKASDRHALDTPTHIDVSVGHAYLSRVKGGKPLPPAIETDLVKLP
jgi:hypothetical protein